MMGAPHLLVTPIGRLRTPWHTTTECPRNGRRGDTPLCLVEVDAPYVPGLKDLEGYTHLILMYWLNQSGMPVMQFTPPNDTEPRGMFATRTPRRPNPIGLSVVRFEGFSEPGVLNVRYLDCVDGTPLLDIKPYLSSVPAEALRRGWMEDLER